MRVFKNTGFGVNFVLNSFIFSITNQLTLNKFIHHDKLAQQGMCEKLMLVKVSRSLNVYELVSMF